MDRFKKILVPIDGKRGSYNCLELATHIAVKNNSEVHLLHIVDLGSISKVAYLSDGCESEMIEKAEKLGKLYCENFINKIEKQYKRTFNYIIHIIKAKKIDEAIIDYTQANSIDLIVIALTVKKHAEDIMVGHVTLRIVEFAHVPVLTLPVSPENEW
ncbi:MAG: universal stress protein [Promethearchaeota archaeon]